MGLEKREDGPLAAELAFEVPTEACFLVAASARADCRLALRALQPRSDGRSLALCSVDGADPERLGAFCEQQATVSECRLLERRDEGGFLQLGFDEGGVATTLADAGAVPHEIRASDGAGRIVAVVPPGVSVRDVVDAVEERYDAVELVACRRRSGVRLDETGPDSGSLLDELTDRQREAIRTAHSRGYFAWPREETAEECADALGVAQPTFSQHLRAGQAKLFDRLFDPEASRDTQSS